MNRDFSSVRWGLQQAIDATPGSAPRSHLTTVQAQIAAIERGDLDGVLAHAAADLALEIFAPPEFGWICHARGVTEIRAALQQNFAAVDDQHPHVEDVLAQGDSVVLFGREQGRIRASGKPYDVEFVQKFTFQDGRLAAVRIIVAHYWR